LGVAIDIIKSPVLVISTGNMMKQWIDGHRVDGTIIIAITSKKSDPHQI
jgi:hypothetical protein